jgi:hypothetical protein
MFSSSRYPNGAAAVSCLTSCWQGYYPDKQEFYALREAFFESLYYPAMLHLQRNIKAIAR